MIALSPERKLERLAQCARGVLDLVYTPDCCIAATRAGLSVLDALGIKARPRYVLAVAANAEWIADTHTGYMFGRTPPAWAVMIDPDETINLKKIGGHVVIVGKVGSSKFLLDLSAYQFNRPARGIHIPEARLVGFRKPLVGSWAVGSQLAGGGLLGWRAHPKEHASTWQQAPDWTLPAEQHRRTHGAVVEQLLIEIERTTP